METINLDCITVYDAARRSRIIYNMTSKMLIDGDTKKINEERRKIIDDYNSQKERNAKIDVVASQRQSDAAQNLSLIIVGLPLYIYHWRLVKREKSVDKR